VPLLRYSSGTVIFKVSASLNLASQPFRNRALPWTIAGVITVLSLLAIVYLVSQGAEANRNAVTVERDADAERKQLSELDRRIEAIKQELTPEQLATLRAAHALVDRKRFFWARLFSDLEAALPDSVRVKRISVSDVGVRNGRMVASLELVIASKNPADATEMISGMDRAGIFRSELVEQNLKTERNETLTESTLAVIYMPRGSVPASETSSTKDVAAAKMVQAVSTETR
jgi:Tfp pilus assembly protein PilN